MLAFAATVWFLVLEGMRPERPERWTVADAQVVCDEVRARVARDANGPWFVAQAVQIVDGRRTCFTRLRIIEGGQLKLAPAALEDSPD